ncbi:MAG: ROK family protein, partial [Stackebrandtia sp.]
MTDLPTAGATDQSLLRRINIVSTLRALRGRPSQTLREIAQVTGVSWRTTNELVDELVRQGWAEEVAPDQGGKMGRPARRFRFRSDAGYVLGIDVGVHKVLALLADLDGTVVGTQRVAVDSDSSPKTRLSAVRSAATRSLAAAGIDRSQLRAVTVGTVGIIDDSGKVRISVAPGWTGLDITGALRRSFPCPVLVENDCNLGAAAELWLGIAQASRNTVYVLAGRRTGAGLIIGGRLHRGNHGAAGEIGALPALGWATAQR